MEATAQAQMIPLRVLNRGFNRQPLASVTDYYPSPLRRQSTIEELLLAAQAQYSRAWAQLQWWESALQARQGIEALCRTPFLYLNEYGSQAHALVPTRMLYPQALQTRELDRVERATRYIVSAVRQAREYYTAAASPGVTALSKPLLFFYGALALAQAAVSAVLGVEELERSHGLKVEHEPESQDYQSPFPTLVQWQNRGDFVAFYRVTRWDTLYREPKPAKPPGGWPRFHILECLRVLGSGWGSLPPSVNASRQGDGPLRFLMLPYQAGEAPYLKPGMAIQDYQFVEVPHVVVRYMALMYFSTLARYHPVKWQELLEGATHPEGYVFRVALERIAHEYVGDLASLLPLPQENGALAWYGWSKTVPAIESQYRQPEISVGGPTLPVPRRLEEWEG